MSDSGQILRRSIGIVFSDGGLLALTASLPAQRGEHGEEVVAAVLCDPDAAPVQFDEALISTEYGEDGVQRQGLDAEIAFFRWSVAGREGLGTYEVARADG